MRFLFLATLSVLLPFIANAQSVEMAEAFRADGKIYVVLAVIFVILIGIFSYIFLLDNKIKKIENRLKK